MMYLLNRYVIKEFSKEVLIYIIDKGTDHLIELDGKMRENIIDGIILMNQEKISNAFERLLLDTRHTNVYSIKYYISSINKSEKDLKRFGKRFANSKFYFLNNDNIVAIIKQFELFDQDLIIDIQEGLLNQNQFNALYQVLREIEASDKRQCFYSMCKRAINNPYMLKKLDEFVIIFPEFQKLKMLY